jgi:hypothetical protein
MTTSDSNFPSSPIFSQAEELRKVVLQRDTIVSFQQSTGLLFTVIRETALLLWLVLCFGVVAFTWLSEKAIALGKSVKTGFDDFQENSREQAPAEILSNTGKSVLLTSQSAANYLITYARKQVGIYDD